MAAYNRETLSLDAVGLIHFAYGGNWAIIAWMRGNASWCFGMFVGVASDPIGCS